ncbi:MAG: ABC transporter ATP-binding protein [Flavobacteriales bacterium]
MSNNLLEIKDLVTVFRNNGEVIRAVDEISFSLNKGETLGIVGESGSGKSVTSLSIMQLLPDKIGNIEKGSIKLINEKGDKVDLLQLSEKKMRYYRGNQMAMIFQEPMTSLNPVYKCGEQVLESLRLHEGMTKEEGKERCIELFNEVELKQPEKIYNSFPHEISGGQKQRVMIAMAISCNPSLLIADEPTTALDVTVQKKILELFKNLQKKHNMGIIFITHDLGVIAQLADHVAVMYEGNIVEDNTTEHIFNNPQHPYTKGLLACRPPLIKRLSRLPTISEFMKKQNDGSVIESDKSIETVLDQVTLTEENILKRKNELYSKEPILKVDNLKQHFPVQKGIFSKTVDYTKAVNDVSFEVYPGETLGLVGESGCGKTTLGRSILRLIEPTEGEIIFKGTDIKKLSQKQLISYRKNMQIIFQDPYSSLNPRTTIGEAIMEPMIVHNKYDSSFMRKKKTMELLQLVGLDSAFFNRYPHEFSGGQRQRICIARALALNPDFIVCDESVSALDVSVQAQVLNLLNELQKEFGLTYIFISHDLSVVKFMSDRILVMNEGVIEERGDAESIHNNPQKEYTQKLINAIPTGELKMDGDKN